MTPIHFALLALFFYVIATLSSFINYNTVDYKSYYSAIFFMMFAIFLELSTHNKK